MPPSLKSVAGLKFGNITICATYMVLLAVDVMENPGPVKDPCAVIIKVVSETRRPSSVILVYLVSR